MSNRAMASRYSAPQSYYGSGGSLLDMIMGLVNPLQGGPTFDAQGNPVFRPYSGRGSKELNAQMALPLYMSQQNFSHEKELLKTKHGYDQESETQRAANATALQTLVNSGAIDLEKLRGTNAINLSSFNADVQKTLEGLKHTNAKEMEQLKGSELRKGMETSGKEDRQSVITRQQANVLGEKGIPFSPENLGVYNQTQVDPIMRAMLNDNMLRIKAQEDLNSQQAATTGFQQSLLAPAFRNVREATTLLPPNNAALIPNIPGTTNYLNAAGPFASETTQMIGESRIPQGMPGAGTVMSPGKPVTTTTYSGGGLKMSLQELMKKAAEVIPSSPSSTNSIPEQPQYQVNPNPFGTYNNLNDVSNMMKLFGY